MFAIAMQPLPDQYRVTDPVYQTYDWAVYYALTVPAWVPWRVYVEAKDGLDPLYLDPNRN